MIASVAGRTRGEGQNKQAMHMSGFTFSANLGFLWRDLPFLERIGRAAAAGFDALEFHDEAQGVDRVALKQALERAGLPVVSLNTCNGGTAGCAAIPDRADEARRDIAAAIDAAQDIGARAIHVLSGITQSQGAGAALAASLHFALNRTKCIILIEPICRLAMPGYFLNDLDLAAGIIAEIGHPRLKLMFDCFHIETEHGGTLERFVHHAADVGHVQIAGVPGRAEPSSGSLDYPTLLPAFQAAGYAGPFGCEYTPAASVEAGLGWRDAFRC